LTVASVESLSSKYVSPRDKSPDYMLTVAEQKPFDIKDYDKTVRGD